MIQGSGWMTLRYAYNEAKTLDIAKAKRIESLQHHTFFEKKCIGLLRRSPFLHHSYIITNKELKEVHPRRPLYLSDLLGISLTPVLSSQVLKVKQLFCSSGNTAVVCTSLYVYIYILLLQSFENLPTTHRHIADTHNFLNSQQVGKPGVHSFWGQNYSCEQFFIFFYRFQTLPVL